ALGIEKCMGKAKEGIESKGFMKRSKKGGFWTLQVAHATLKQRADLVLSRPKLRMQYSKHTYATSSPKAFEEHFGQSCVRNSPMLRTQLHTTATH
ncbi:hypothetical protein PIB30_054232, partial [Stylosanthes scabra]|nr:hypothetical protein [Stylosanthes scabra]